MSRRVTTVAVTATLVLLVLLLARGRRKPAVGQCTLLINVYSRPHAVPDTILHYAASDRLVKIVLLWAGPSPVPLLPSVAVPVEVIKPPTSSLNWRFHDWPELRISECVVHMDDDWRMPMSHINRAIDVWHAGYQDHWVGFEHMGRNHVERVLPNGQSAIIYAPTFWSQYAAQPSKIPPVPFHSIVLPSGSVLHRRFLAKYSFNTALAPARELVDERINCEDLLMSFLVANLTRQGPALIRAWHKPIQVDGLWHRTAHLAERTACLQDYVRLFGHDPLRYTTTYIPLAGLIPDVDSFSSQSSLPHDFACRSEVYSKSGVCELDNTVQGWLRLGTQWS